MRQGPDSPDRSISVLVSGLCGDLVQDACASSMNQFAVRGTQVTAEACRSIHNAGRWAPFFDSELEGRDPGLSTQIPGERGEAHPRLEALRRCAERPPGPRSFLPSSCEHFVARISPFNSDMSHTCKASPIKRKLALETEARQCAQMQVLRPQNLMPGCLCCRRGA